MWVLITEKIEKVLRNSIKLKFYGLKETRYYARLLDHLSCVKTTEALTGRRHLPIWNSIRVMKIKHLLIPDNFGRIQTILFLGESIRQKLTRRKSK